MSIIKSIIRSDLYDYSNVCIHVKGTITVRNTGTAATPNYWNKNLIFKICAPFINCIYKINKTQVDDAHGIDVVMSMYNLIEYSYNYLKISGSLWQYYREKPTLGNNGNIIDFSNDNNNNTISSNLNCELLEKQETMAEKM